MGGDNGDRTDGQAAESASVVPVMWDLNANTTLALTAYGDRDCEAWDLNEFWQVVGTACSAAGVCRGFLAGGGV